MLNDDLVSTCGRGVVLATVLAGLVACGGGDPTGGGSEALCPGLVFTGSTGAPMDEIEVLGIPDDFEDPIAARVVASGGTATGHALIVLDDADGAHLLVPVHPTGSMDGGPVELTLTDGTRECPSVAFTIEGLPAADGELAAVVQVLQDLFRDRAAALGTTPEALLAMDFADLPELYYPLAVEQSLLDFPGNEHSLLAVANGTSPLSDPVAVDIVNRIFRHIGLRAALASVTPSMAYSSAARAPVTDPSVDCTPAGIGSDAQRLDGCMQLALELTLDLQGAGQEVLDDLQMAVGALGLVPNPGVEIGAAVVGLGLLLVENARREAAGMLPASLVAMSVEFGQTEYLEDEVGPGGWTYAEVIASSDGFDMGKAVLENILALNGLGRALEKFGGAKVLSDLAIYIVSAGWIPFLLEDGTLDAFQVDPMLFGPVDVTSEEWSESSVPLGDAVEFTSHTIYELRNVGTATVSVRTKDGSFGNQGISEQTQVTVGQLSVRIAPEEIIVEPGEITFFTVTVEDAAFPDAVDILASISLQGEADITYEGGNTHSVAYTAPASPNSQFPDLLTVEHISTQGARGGDAPPRRAIATIRFGGVRITTDPTCLVPGGQPLALEVELAGGLEGAELVWSATDGSVSSDGTFSPPLTSGIVTVTVALASNPNLKDTIDLQVGGCTCQGSAILDGLSETTRSLRFFLSEDLTEIRSIEWGGANLASASLFSFGPDFNVTVNIPVGTTGTFPAHSTGYMAPFGWLNPDNIADPPSTPLTLILTENVGGSIVTGTASGEVGVIDGGQTRRASLTMTFHIEADPMWSTATRRECRVE